MASFCTDTEKQRLDLCLRSVFELPRATHVVSAELIRVAGPPGCAVESATSGTGGIRTAAKLVVNGVHQVLADAPRVRLPHVSCGGNNQCQRLSVHLIVVISMPRTVHGKVVGPYLGHAVGIASRRSRLRGCDGSGHQANGEDDSVDHGRLIHLGLMDCVSTVRGLTCCCSG